MLKSTFILLFCLLTGSVQGQEKRDYNWLFGRLPNNIANKSGGTQIDFNTSPPTISFFNIPLSFLANTAISDPAGNLLFYSNGCFVANRNHEIMLHGDSLNYGAQYENWCAAHDIGYPAHQGILTLPWPGQPNRYALLHYRTGDTGGIHSSLLYSEIDMNLDGGLGAVTTKNQLLGLAFYASNLTAVRHGNGRDWWIIAPIHHTKLYHKFLFTPEGFSGPFLDEFGTIWTLVQGGSQDCFSPNGQKYIRMSPNGGQITDFDRCTGNFSNPLKLSFSGDTVQANGCAVSSNNRFLYITTTYKIYQFDLEANDISASRILLDYWDGTQWPLEAFFFQAMPAPDGKIYLSSPNGVPVLHVIHHPNELGLAADFEQHGILLPTTALFPIPNFPHFRLYDWSDSPCDTLGIDAPVVATASPARPAGPLRLLPNPLVAGEALRVEAGELFLPEDRLVLFNAVGQAMREPILPRGASQLTVSTAGLAPGAYTTVLWRAGGWRQVGKFVVVRTP